MSLLELAALILAYLLGSIPFGYLIVKFGSGKDVRTAGSGATGATNVMRTTGKAAGYATFALDILKGVAAVIIVRLMTGSAWWETTWVAAGAAILAIIGHIFPVWLGFKAGKGVATGLGVFLAIAPLASLCTFAVFVLIVIKTRYISLGSVIGTLLMPLWILLFHGWISHSPYLIHMLVAISVVAALIVLKHTDNIKRLMAGTESKFGQAKAATN